MKVALSFCLSALLATSFSLLQAASPLGGLTVAVSSDGTQLVAGGDSRTLLVLDPESLEVKDRHWVGTSIVDLVFNGDGSILAVYDTSGTVYLYNTGDWSQITEIKKVMNFSAAVEGGLIAGQDGDYKAPQVQVFSFSDGTLQSSVPLPEGQRIASLGINDEGTKIAVLFQGVDDEGETKVERADIPKDLKGIAKTEFEQKNDGKTSRYFVIDVATATIEKETTVFFNESNGSLVFVGDDVFFVTYRNMNVKMTPEGEITLFELANSFNYGIGFTRDHGIILTGGLANYSITPVDTLTSVTGKIDKLPGWPEYFKGFTGTKDGSALYGATSAYRVMKFSPDGAVSATMQGH
ncbi:MAG: hypothetical protein P1U68_05945 [Verrucomicrobiales bacterium]|nr:hypothetical protein [Verrucomicrobiales bacterium]